MAESHRMDVVIKAHDKATGVLNRIAGKMGMTTKQGLAMGLAFKAIDLGVQAVMQAFSKMQQYITEVRTMLDIVGEQQLPNMTKGIEAMSVAFGKSAVDLARGLYQVLSAGIDAAKSMDVLRASAKLAVATLTSVETAVDAVTTVLNAYGMNAIQAKNVTEIMAKTIQLGKVRMEELANALGYIVPIAAQAGISFEEISAALATLTKQGINAQKATRGLRQVVNNLIAPSEEATIAMGEMGVAYDDLVIEAIGLSGVMEKINIATDGQIGKISMLIPNVQALSTALGLIGTQSIVFHDSLNYIESDFSALDEMFSDIATTAVFTRDQLDEFGNTVERSIGKQAFDPIQTLTTLWDTFMGVVGAGGDPMEYWSGAVDIFSGVADEMGKVFDVTQITHYGAKFDELNTLIVNQEALVTKLTGRLSQYNRELGFMETTRDITIATHDWNEALHFIPLALKDASYTAKIFDINTQALVDSIRMQRHELERLSEVQRDYNRETQVNTIAMIKIQLAADQRRGRMTRNEKQQIEELQQANTQLRINTLTNQMAIDDAKRDLSPEEERLNAIKTFYAEQIKVTNDTWNRDLELMDINIDSKKQLIDDYANPETGYIAIANQNILDGIELFYDEWLALDNEFQRKLLAQNPQLEGRVRAGQPSWEAAHRVVGVSPLTDGLYYAYSSSGRSKTFTDSPPNVGDIVSWQRGTPFVPQTGLAMLHKGEAVVPAAQNTGGMGGKVHVDPMTINVNIYDNADIPHLVQKIELALQSGLLSGLTTGYR